MTGAREPLGTPVIGALNGPNLNLLGRPAGYGFAIRHLAAHVPQQTRKDCRELISS